MAAEEEDDGNISGLRFEVECREGQGQLGETWRVVRGGGNCVGNPVLREYDLAHGDEDREIVIGFSYRFRLLFVVIYEFEENTIRIMRPAERPATKDLGTLPKVNVRYVEFTPEEMAYDAPRDTSDPKRFPTIGKDAKSWKKFLTFRNGYAKLKPQLRQTFADDAAVNEALELVVKLRQLPLKKMKNLKTA